MWQRVSGLLLRHLYLYRRSISRVMEVVFWPVMSLMVWGFLSRYLESKALPVAVNYFLGAMILWELLYRSQQSITLSLTEEFWVKNVVNLFVAPLRTIELVLSLCIIGLFKSLIAIIFLGVLAWYLYHFNILVMGTGIVFFFGNLILFGWSVGMVTMSLILRFGHAAEALIWGVPFLIQPIAAVFYPVDVLPAWLKTIALLLPCTHVFEGMRLVLNTGQTDPAMLAYAFGLNLIYLTAAGLFFLWMLHQARVKGYLSRSNIE